MIFHDRIPHEHKYIPFVLQMSVLLIHRSSRFNTEDPNTFTGPEFLSLSRDRLSHEPGKCLLKNMLNQQVLQPGTSLEKHRLFPTENPVSTWPCCGRVLDPRPTLMPWRHVKGPMAQLVAKKHAFWTEPKQPKNGIRCVMSFSCHCHNVMWYQTLTDDHWWPLIWVLGIFRLSAKEATGSPFLLMTNTLAARFGVYMSLLFEASHISEL